MTEQKPSWGAIDFIEADVARSKPRANGLMLLFALGIAVIPAGLGLFLREDMNGVFDPRVLIPNTLAAVGVAWASWGVASKSTLRTPSLALSILMVFLGLFLAVERIAFPIGVRTSYVSSADFWHESMKCLTKGSFSSLAFSIWTAGFAFLCTSLPTRRRRAMICVVSGVAGTVMLGFHCDSSSVAHVLISHIGQGVAVGLVVFLFLEAVFRSILFKNAPELRHKLRSLSKIG